MVRFQAQLTDEQAERLRALAARQRRSAADLVRRAVDMLLDAQLEPSQEERWRRADEVVGRFEEGATDVSSDHDRYLPGAYGG